MTLNVKGFEGSRVTAQEIELVMDAPIWSHITLGFAQNKWNNFDVPWSPSQSFQISFRD